jgi:hypothetical protein
MIPEASGTSKVVIKDIRSLAANKALKITPQSGSSLEQKVASYIAATATGEKGSIGEDIAELLAKELDNAEVLNVKLNNTGHGFDPMVFENGLASPTKIKIFECKTIAPSENRITFDITNNGAQMGNQWTRYTIDRMVKSSQQSVKDVGNLLFVNQNKIERYVLTVDQTTNQIIILKLGDY